MIPSNVPSVVSLGQELSCQSEVVDNTLRLSIGRFADELDYTSLAIRLSREGIIIDRINDSGDITGTACVLWADVAGMTK